MTAWQQIIVCGFRGKCDMNGDAMNFFFLEGVLVCFVVVIMNIYQRNFILSAAFAEIHQGLYLVFSELYDCAEVSVLGVYGICCRVRVFRVTTRNFAWIFMYVCW